VTTWIPQPPPPTVNPPGSSSNTGKAVINESAPPENNTGEPPTTPPTTVPPVVIPTPTPEIEDIINTVQGQLTLFSVFVVFMSGIFMWSYIRRNL
jgi:hypothetical protein